MDDDDDDDEGDDVCCCCSFDDVGVKSTNAEYDNAEKIDTGDDELDMVVVRLLLN